MADIPATRVIGQHHSLPSGQAWRVMIPIGITLILAALPPPPGLAQHAWYYFAMFAGVIAALRAVQPGAARAEARIGDKPERVQ